MFSLFPEFYYDYKIIKPKIVEKVIEINDLSKISTEDLEQELKKRKREDLDKKIEELVKLRESV